MAKKYRHSANSRYRYLEVERGEGNWVELTFAPLQSVHFQEKTLNNPHSMIIPDPSQHFERWVVGYLPNTEIPIEGRGRVVGYTTTRNEELRILIALPERSLAPSPFLVHEYRPENLLQWESEANANPPVDAVTTVMNMIQRIEELVPASQIPAAEKSTS